MKSLSLALLVSLSIGVAAPVAARPRVPVTAWPGVSDVLSRTPSQTAAFWCSDQSLQRLVAEFAYFESPDEVDTDDYTGIYQKRGFEVPDGCNTLYVTISAVGEVANDNDLLLRCVLDGLYCIGSSAPVDRGMGWMILTSDVVGYLDSDGTETLDYKVPINYTWCIANVSPGFHNLLIELANEVSGEGQVSITTAHFYVDASHFDTGGCVEGDPGAGGNDGILPPVRTPVAPRAPASAPPILPPLPKLP